MEKTESIEKIKIVFMGTPDFAVPSLQACIDSDVADVVGVVTQPDRPAGRGNKLKPPPVKVAAEAAGIPVFQPQSLRKYEAAEPIRDWNPDLIVVTAFGQILRPHVLDLPRLGCVNVHASLLPRWRGAAPIQAAILGGDKQTGVTLMHMDVGLDTGDMLFVEAFDLDPAETASTLHDKLAQLGYDMLLNRLPDIAAGAINPIQQPEEGVTYAAKIDKSDGHIDWSQPAELIERRHRAMTPWPGSFTEWDGKNLKVKGMTLLAIDHPVKPAGTVLRIEDDIFVVTGDGLIRLDEIQLEGKKRTEPLNFINGRPEFVGSVLG